MTRLLDNIVARKRIEVEKAKSITPLEVLEERVTDLGRPRNFFGAVTDRGQRRTRVIAEIKRRSPSAGIIRDDFDPVDIAKQYHQAGAAAISCLTDEADFGGHLGYISQIRDAMPLPVLRKDFIVDQYQIWESRAAEADAVLLIGEVLDESELLDMLILVHQLKMTSLVEVHDLDRLLKVRHYIGFPHAGYSLLGINNRNLKTMETDVSHILRLVEFVENRSVVVCESGIQSPADLARLRQRGINIALVGEHLLRASDPGDALRELLARTPRSDNREAG
ncbi:MAG: indole-3-glycerol phosphate synthase TrpC [Planctomycetota bacterium]|jgi:indole-3-glycerol phosphate synthase